MLSAFSVTNDLASCTRCSGVRSVDFRGFRSRVAGRPFRFVLDFHLRRHDREMLERGRAGSLAVLPPAARRLGRETAEEWIREIREGDLAETDCGEVVDRLEARAEEEAGGKLADDQLFDLFEVVTLSVALEALDEDELREAVVGERDLLSRYGWNLAAALALGYLLTVVEGTLWTTLLWAAMGLTVLPPVARIVGRREEGG